MSNNDFFQTVVTYNHDAQLPSFVNQNCFVSEICNHKYSDFNKNISANLGDTVAIELPYSFSAIAGLVVSQQPVNQNIAHLPVTQSANITYPVTAQQFIFNLEKDSFYESIGKGMVHSLGATVEQGLAKHIVSAAIDERQGTSTYGQPQVQSGPTRFVDFTAAGITSYQQLDQMHSNFISMGAPATDHMVVLPTNRFSPIIGSGLNQFVPKRNDEIANSWLVGEFGTPPTKYYRSNALPVQTAGTLGQAGTTLTVVSTNDPTGTNITSITFSGAGSDNNAVKAGDMGYFLPSAGINALTFYGQMVTDQPVQFRVIADAVSSGGNVTVQIVVATHTEGQGFCAVSGNSFQNISGNIVAGMQAKFLGSHKAGLLVTGKAFYAAMPRLPKTSPYTSSVDTDPDTNVSLRMYGGDIFGQNTKLLVNDCIWGALLVPRYCLRICLPVNYAG